ncbi:hypothetical protein [Leisingera sp. M527]|uniref:hypothetical protein n=1 Tax=Leisingera sp. M527 TaxID=2867014 RepID=UPI0021A4FE49|nr:hypothetical protein [Leisingera sp. M527]
MKAALPAPYLTGILLAYGVFMIAMGKITKQGDRCIRKLLAVGMATRAVMAKRSPEKAGLWTAKIIADKPFRLATTAMANKAARAVSAMLTKKQEYRQPAF